MKSISQKILGNFALFVLISSGIIMAYMLIKLNETEENIAQSLTVKPVQNTETEMKRFFLPVNNELVAAGMRGKKGFYYDLSVQSLNKFYIPIIEKFDQLSSMGLAKSNGYELDIIPKDKLYLNREVNFDENPTLEEWSTWKYDKNNISKIENWEDTLKNDPRGRPWFIGALQKTNLDQVYWTEPYLYNTTFELGITASVSWTAEDFDSLTYVLAYDLTLNDISKFTESLKATPNSMTFVLTEDEKFIGLPKSDLLKTDVQKNETFLKNPSETSVPVIGYALEIWKEKNNIDEPFHVIYNNEDWWFYFKHFELSAERTLILGVAIPENDILFQINQTKYTILGGFSMVFLLSLVVFISLKQTQKTNKTLFAKNIEIELKNSIIEEKNKDIFDSLNYAKGLQDAILPRKSDMNHHLKDYFVLFKPKEVVSGDFYWMNTTKDENGYDRILYAAADCTGHGVPGAMVSVVCANSLNRCVKEYKIHQPGAILDKTRDLIIETFEKSEKKLRDGMDISLVSLNISNKSECSLDFAGANNPLWIIRKTDVDLKANIPHPITKNDKNEAIQLIEIKADKQPVGNSETLSPFITKSFKLEKGDLIYSFSDGFADQFGFPDHNNQRDVGGKKFKTLNLKKLLLDIYDKPMDEQKEILLNTYNNWKGSLEQIDDVCIIGVHIT